MNNSFTMKNNNNIIIKFLIMALFIITLLFIISFTNSHNSDKYDADIQHMISTKIIRFHILANSNSKDDQNLKLAVRDEVLNYINPLLENAADISSARNILTTNIISINDVASKVIEDMGYNYPVTSYITNCEFPKKTYGNITLPSGTYESFRIEIGSSKGHNWWCVMYPSLCFTDLSSCNITEQSEKKLGKALSKEEYSYVTSDNIHYESKIINIIKKFFK